MEAIKPEIKRLAYLKALGVESWYAPAPLPGAAPSPELDWFMYSGETLDEAEADQVNSEATLSSLEVDLSSSEKSVSNKIEAPAQLISVESRSPVEDKREEHQPNSDNESTAPTSEPLVFTLHLTQVEGKGLILADLQDPEAPGFSSEEFHLMEALLFSLGWDQVKLNNTLFKWPYTPNKNIPQGAVEANQAITAYIDNLVGKESGKLILLGRYAMEMVTGKFGEFDTLIATPNDAEKEIVSYSLNELINQPSLKRHLWQRLSRLLS